MKNFLKTLTSHLLAIFLIFSIPVFCILFSRAAILTFMTILSIGILIILYISVLLLGEKINEKFFK